MSTGLIDIMKRAAIDANESNKPADLRFGTVTSVNPLKIQVTNQFILPKSVLIIPEHLTDYEIEVTVKDLTFKTGQDERIEYFYNCEYLSGTFELNGEEIERNTETNYYEPMFIDINNIDCYNIQEEVKEYIKNS